METDLVRLQRKLAKVTALFTSQSNELREKDKALSEKEAELVSVSTANAELLEENSKVPSSLRSHGRDITFIQLLSHN